MQQRKQLKRTTQRAKRGQRNKEGFLNDGDDEEIVEADDEDEDEIADEDDEEGEEYSGDVSFNMTSKEDPNFSPGIDSIKKAAASQPIRRSSR